MCANLQFAQSVPREGYAPLDNAELFYREVGHGQPIIVIHGGPDFDHTYLLPDMDRLSDSYRLIYYDQRWRGKSTSTIPPDDITIQTEIDDLEGLRKHFQLDSVAVLGHSWGGYLAMEYAIRHPDRVSHMILMNTGVASHEDYLLLQQELSRRKAPYREELNALLASAAYKGGDPDAVAQYYRIHFGTTIKQPHLLEGLIERMQIGFTKEGILRGWQVEEMLINETWLSGDCDLFPKLGQLSTPTLVVHGDYDVIPAECAARISQAVPGARFVLLRESGHFAYMESPDQVRKEIADFFVK
ncbi:MAG TPA: alpha/beta fold hydrolase [Chloroflexia bacterium]|nr:alpha/beta fold hydrolase [Chloroflexia bacterium]